MRSSLGSRFARFALPPSKRISSVPALVRRLTVPASAEVIRIELPLHAIVSIGLELPVGTNAAGRFRHHNARHLLRPCDLPKISRTSAAGSARVGAGATGAAGGGASAFGIAVQPATASISAPSAP
jgi:hypothetical protein